LRRSATGSVVWKHSDHEEQEQRGSGESAGVFSCHSASVPRTTLEAASARLLVCYSEQLASVIEQGCAVRIVARARHAEDSPLWTSRIPAHARKSTLHTGATPKVVQEQLRHADPRVTLGMYSHVIGEDRRNAVERVAALLRPSADASCSQLRPIAPKSATQEEWIQ
jgi:hypothetical protein